MSEPTPTEVNDSKGVLILRHLQAEGACLFGKILNERGFRMRSILAPNFDMETIDPLRPDLLIIMGGPIGVYQKDHYPFLKQEIAIAKERLEADLPTLGICLGAQIMANALGSDIVKGTTGKEVGWKPLSLSEQAQDTEFRHLCGSQTSMFHWHGDTFELPKGANLMASTDCYDNQVFTYGENCAGFQCHPEVHSDQLPEWFVMFVGQITGENPVAPIEDLRAQTNQHIGKLNTQARLFFEEWLDNRGL